MQASKIDLENLFQAHELRIRLARIAAQVQELKSGAVLREKEADRIKVSGELSNALHMLDELETELKRAESDLELVETRIAKDTLALNSTSSTKDATGLQHELQTLAKRKSDLEDAELELLDRIDVQKRVVESLTQLREQINQELIVAQAELVERVADLERELEAEQLVLDQLVVKIPTDLWGLYQTKSRRGVAIGRLMKLVCSACNMGLTSAAYKEISSTPIDQLVTCSECGAILIRDA